MENAVSAKTQRRAIDEATHLRRLAYLFPLSRPVFWAIRGPFGRWLSSSCGNALAFPDDVAAGAFT